MAARQCSSFHVSSVSMSKSKYRPDLVTSPAIICHRISQAHHPHPLNHNVYVYTILPEAPHLIPRISPTLPQRPSHHQPFTLAFLFSPLLSSSYSKSQTTTSLNTYFPFLPLYKLPTPLIPPTHPTRNLPPPLLSLFSPSFSLSLSPSPSKVPRALIHPHVRASCAFSSPPLAHHHNTPLPPTTRPPLDPTPPPYLSRPHLPIWTVVGAVGEAGWIWGRRGWGWE